MKKNLLILGLALLLNAASGFAQGGTTGPLTWKIEDNTLTISGEGAMPDYETVPFYTTTPWYEYRESIHSVVIEMGVTRIGDLAFKSCEKLSSVIIPNSVTSIGVHSFLYCTILPSIVIPSSVTSLYGNAFAACTRLTSIDVESDNNHYASEDGVLFDKNKSILMFCPQGKTGDYVIPNSVTSIEEDAFAGCKWLTSIIIPNGVTKIATTTFSGCTSLTSIIIPNSVTSIGIVAFGGCTSLTSIIIPSGVTKIETGAFSSCKSLTLITNLNPVPVTINDKVFDGVNKGACTLEVPINSVDAYRNAAVWKEFKIVGVEVGMEPIEEPAFKTYPNPTTGKVYIETESNIKVYDAQGILLQETFGNQVDLSAYPQGVYFLQVNDGRWGRVVKQ